MAVIRTVADLSVANFFQIYAFQMAMKGAVQNFLAEPHVAKDMVTSTIDLRAFTVPVAEFVKDVVEKRFLV